MRSLLVVILGMVLFSGRGLAQEDNFARATSSLQYVLTTLKQSVEKLSLDNDQLTVRDNAMKQQLFQLQTQLGQLEAQGDSLNKSADKLQDKNSNRAQQVARLEGENFDLDNRIQKSGVAIQSIQQSLDAGYQEDQRLLLQLKDIHHGPPVPREAVQSPESQAAARSQKEKLKLMKMIYDSQQRQEALHGAILEFQQNTPLMPAVSSLAHQQQLKEQLKDLQDQMAAYPPENTPANAGAASQWDDAQMHQLEGELKFLEKNYAQLKDLMEQMSKKAQSVRMTVSQHMEERKLQGGIDDLKRQGEGLKADLDDLRSQMVELDKLKSHLEIMSQHN